MKVARPTSSQERLSFLLRFRRHKSFFLVHEPLPTDGRLSATQASRPGPLRRARDGRKDSKNKAMWLSYWSSNGSYRWCYHFYSCVRSRLRSVLPARGRGASCPTLRNPSRDGNGTYQGHAQGRRPGSGRSRRAGW